jgi:hypothetical protein
MQEDWFEYLLVLWGLVSRTGEQTLAGMSYLPGLWVHWMGIIA